MLRHVIRVDDDDEKINEKGTAIDSFELRHSFVMNEIFFSKDSV